MIKRALPLLAATLLFIAPSFAQDAAPQPAPAPELQLEQLELDHLRAMQTGNAPTPSEQELVEVPPPQQLGHTYAPEYCEFSTAFPAEPYLEQHCDGGESGTECYDAVSYTQTFDLAATVFMKVICNPIGEDIKNKYTQEVMVKTLEAMSKDEIKETIQTSYRADEQNRYRMAGLVAEGSQGVTPSIFIAQMWLGDTSALTVEAELIGEPYVEADALFRDLLQSIAYKAEIQEKAAQDGNETANPAP